MVSNGQPTEVTTTVYATYYGYYVYQEGSGITYLDSLIANSGTSASGTFFPVIPIRTNTAWYTGDKATRISNTLRFLEIYDSIKNRVDPYAALRTSLANNIQEGSLSDIDYMTLIHGVTLNTTNQSDLKYIYTFFLNLHINEALSKGRDPLAVWNPRPTYVGSNYFGAFIENTVHKWHTNDGGKKTFFRINDIGQSFHHKFNITCSSSNLNYEYSWAMSEYFEANGKFRPDAKVGEYGVQTLSNKYTWTTEEQEVEMDGEGSVIRTYTVTVTHSIPFTFTAFCYQASEDRWRFTLFVCLELTNYIYAGKSIITTAYEAVTDNSQVTSVTHNFVNDFAYDQYYWDEVAKANKLRSGYSWKSIFSEVLGRAVLTSEEDVAEDFRTQNPFQWLTLTFKYGTGLPDSTSPFIVPFELNTFNEVGARVQTDITNGGLFLVCNCWVQVTYKKKWYQKGIFKSFGGLFGIALGALISFVLPAIGTTLIVVSTVVGSITLGAKLLTIARKILVSIFGEKFGKWVYTIIKLVVYVVVAIWAPYALPFVAAGVAASETYAQTGSLSKSIGMGAIAGISAYVMQQGFEYAGDVANAGETGTLDAVSNSAQSAYNSADGFFTGVSDGMSAGMDVMSETMSSIAGNPTALGIFAGGTAVAGLVQGLGSTLVNGGAFKDALTTGLVQGAIAGISTLVTLGGADLFKQLFTSEEDKLLLEVSHTYYTEENIVQGEEILGGLANANYGVMQDPSFFDKVAGLISKKLLNMDSVTELATQSSETRYMRKLARLQNDYDEWLNAYQNYQNVTNTIQSQITSTVTAEHVAKLQASSGRLLTMFPDSLGNLSCENVLSFATTCEIPLVCTMSVSTYTEDRLTLIGGYAPEPLYFNQEFLAWALMHT